MNDNQYLSTLKFSSPQLIPLILIAFFHTPFQDQPNSPIPGKTSGDENKVCGGPDFFPCVHRPRGL